MKKVVVRAPVRADLAGGTLDLWPIYLFHPGSRTVNTAISFYAESEVVETGDDAIEIFLTDQQYRQRYESMQELAADPKAALIYRILEHFRITGVHITTRTDAPRGSGLGGSSALSITLVRAISELTGSPFDGDNLVFLVRDLETRLLGVPAGIQDYYPPVFGGLASLRLEPGYPVRHPLAVSASDLGAHMLMHYTGVAHFSGTNNWEMYKRQIEGKKKVHKGFSKIAATAIEMERALEAGDFPAAGKALAAEWENRKALIDGISTPEIDAAIAAATAAGAWAGKVCGAGGGGCIVFLFPPERRQAIVDALAAVPGRVLDAAPVQHGMTVHSSEDGAESVSADRTRVPSRSRGGETEQLFVADGRRPYLPFVLAESVLVHVEGRSGMRQTSMACYLAPVEPESGQVRWQDAVPTDSGRLNMSAVPDPERRFGSDVAPEVLAQKVKDSHEAFVQMLSERHRLQVLHNPSFNLFSQPQESRSAFLDRCIEEANRRIEDNSERLESTFRRRIDQLRERSEREQRDEEKKDEGDRDETVQQVNVAWGQTLYNITSGRPAAVTEPPKSVREGDYLENIAQIQKSWDREQVTLKEELLARAKEIEEIVVVPKDIEVTKLVIVWAGALPA